MYLDPNGKRRPHWWNSSDQAVWGHVTEEDFAKSREYFSRMLRARDRIEKVRWPIELRVIRLLKTI